MTPLLKRILTASLLLGGFVATAVWAPEWLWAALMAVIAALAAYEWGRLSAFTPTASRVYAILLGVTALALPTLWPAQWPLVQMVLAAIAAGFWLVLAPLWLIGRWRAERPFVRAAVGVVLLLPSWAALVYLQSRGATILFVVMAIVWLADTAAYFAGRAFGRHKLAPAISPGKTWEGVAGAWVVIAIYAGLVASWMGAAPATLILMFSGLLYVSVLGDLFESWIKRTSGMKDSGTLLPGHGGVLDRIDALTSTLPLAMGMLLWLERAA